MPPQRGFTRDWTRCAEDRKALAFDVRSGPAEVGTEFAYASKKANSSGLLVNMALLA